MAFQVKRGRAATVLCVTWECCFFWWKGGPYSDSCLVNLNDDDSRAWREMIHHHASLGLCTLSIPARWMAWFLFLFQASCCSASRPRASPCFPSFHQSAVHGRNACVRALVSCASLSTLERLPQILWPLLISSLPPPPCFPFREQSRGIQALGWASIHRSEKEKPRLNVQQLLQQGFDLFPIHRFGVAKEDEKWIGALGARGERRRNVRGKVTTVHITVSISGPYFL